MIGHQLASERDAYVVHACTVRVMMVMIDKALIYTS